MAAINGTRRDDALAGTEDTDTIDGRAGNDTLRGLGGDDLLRGGDGIDSLSGDDGADMLLGGVGDDFLGGGLGADTFDGGAGNDTVSFGSSPVEVDLAAGHALTACGREAVRGIENVNAGSGDDVLRGNGAANRLNGFGGSDEIRGGGGNDVLSGDNFSSGAADRLFGGAGADSLYGGEGDDLLAGGPGSDAISQYARTLDGDDTVLGFTNEDQLALLLPFSAGRYFAASPEDIDTDGDGVLGEGDDAVSVTSVTFEGETRTSTVVDLGILSGQPGTGSTLTLFGATGISADVVHG